MDYRIVKCTRCGKDRWAGPAPVCWPCQQEIARTHPTASAGPEEN